MHTEPTRSQAPQSVSISGAQTAAIRLRAGAVVAARVLEAGGPDGRGLLSLAGAIVRARLPAGIAAGDRLRLLVVGREGDRIVLRRVAEERAGAGRLPASLVAELAESGDGEQLRAAVALAGGPIALPGARVLTVEPDGDEPGREASGEDAVRVVLHTPSLGALELRVGLRGSGLEVSVTASAPVAAAAVEAAPALRASVQSSTGLPARVEVVEREGAAPAAPVVPPLPAVERFA